MAKEAIILYQEHFGSNELRLGRTLDFFGVPWQRVDARSIKERPGNSVNCAGFGSVRAVAAALAGLSPNRASAGWLEALYAYGPEEKGSCLEDLQYILNRADAFFQTLPRARVTVKIADQVDTAGPMAGLKFTSNVSSQNTVIAEDFADGQPDFTTIISAGGWPIFIRSLHGGIPVFFCASSEIVDIDQPVGKGFYDVKDHLSSAVPLVMFIRRVFPDVAWKPQELGACLIIDDPYLRAQYGFCNFSNLRDLMQQNGFTTNIAFIPWNWRRTSRSASELFNKESSLFSISIHGCDHTASEFGITSLDALHEKAWLAQSRMKKHEARTGIRHDPVMVFPQGVFSSSCPEVLKRNQYLGAVNTEIEPVDSVDARTRIRDVWDTAIMSYGGFPIFTRRYPFHGMENFAFDLLLGKPCLIVAHHENLKDGGKELTRLVKSIGERHCPVHWRPLGDVIRRACRRRANPDGVEEVEMYGNELLIDNPEARPIQVTIRKKSGQSDPVSEVFCNGEPIEWTINAGYLVFSGSILPGTESRFKVQYQNIADPATIDRSLRFELAVAARRVLSEFRDQYFSRIRYSLAHRMRKGTSDSQFC